MFEKLSVWMFVALILLVDGLIILVHGIVNWRHDGVAAVAGYHPSVCWGGFMMVFAIILILINRRIKH